MCLYFGILASKLHADPMWGLLFPTARVGSMFKVTVRQEEASETWELEGKLSGDWVKELERCWKERISLAGVPLQVHLKAVSYIDAAGKQLLMQMHVRGVAIVGCGCMTKAVVEEITGLSGTN
jgi:hypothetical protein